MIVVFLGPPGGGKGTQAERVCRDKGWKHLSTGVILREAVEQGTELGRKARDYMDQGNLVPDDVMLALIDEHTTGRAPGYVLDGFPRTRVQAEGLDRLLEGHGRKVDHVVYLKTDVEEVVRRLAARGRADDDPETVRHRLRVYEENTKPLIGYYRERGLLREIDGVGPIEEIERRILAVLGD